VFFGIYVKLKTHLSEALFEVGKLNLLGDKIIVRRSRIFMSLKPIAHHFMRGLQLDRCVA